MTTFENTTCEAIYNEMIAQVNDWATGDPAGGKYSLYESEEYNYVWTTRRTGGKGKYVDDQIFLLT